MDNPDKPTLVQRFRYWFDNAMGRGLVSMLWFLGVVTAIFIILNTFVVKLINSGEGGEADSWAEVLWTNFVTTLNAKDFASSSPWLFRIVMAVVATVGLGLVAMLIGIISSFFRDKVNGLRKGRTPVLETGHTVIIGWNPKIFHILNGLVEANKSSRGATVVILADKDKVEMDDEIADKIGHNRGVKILTRSGDPLDQDVLMRVRPFRARSVILLAADEFPDADARVIKIALALSRHPLRAGRPLHLVGQISKARNMQVAKIAGSENTQWVLGTEKIGQIAAQTAHQPGLSAVYTELLSFAGNEIYFVHQPELAGTTYAEAQLKYNTSTVIGVIADGEVTLNPPGNTQLGPGARVVVIAEDDSVVAPDAPGVAVKSNIVAAKRLPKKPTKSLILGANRELPHVVRELDAYAAKGSTITIVSDFKVRDLDKTVNAKVTVADGDTTDRDVLERLKPHGYDHVIVLAYSHDLPLAQADTRTLVTLLHLRDIMQTTGKDFTVVSEMLDERNRKLATVTKINDFIVSDHLISLMIAQLSENPKLAGVFGELFAHDGQEIYLRPAERYIKLGPEVDFYTVTAAASARGETAIGYCAAPSEPGGGPQVVVSPANRDRRVYAPGDRIIVISAD